MPRRSTTKKTTKKTAARIPTNSCMAAPVPLGYATLARLIGETDTAEMRTALDAAMRALESVGVRADKTESEIYDYVSDYATKRGPFAGSVRRALAVDPAGNLDGDVYCAYVDPAFLAGLAFAWLMLTGGAR